MKRFTQIGREQNSIDSAWKKCLPCPLPAAADFLPGNSVPLLCEAVNQPGNVVRLWRNVVRLLWTAVSMPCGVVGLPWNSVPLPWSPKFLPWNLVFLPWMLFFNNLRGILPFHPILNNQPSTIN
jgi:hypothetical protein